MKASFQTHIIFVLGIVMFVFTACVPDEPNPPTGNPFDKLDLTPYELEVPDYFPPMAIPEDNPLTEAKVSLGKKLFYDPVLSVDYSVSCNSCHLQEHAFADPKQLSLGVDGTESARHSMPLFNLGYAPYLFWDGRAMTLEQQALMPIEDPLEMKNTVAEVVNRLQADSNYIELFHTAFGKDPDADGIAKALASFERTIVSHNAPIDKFKKRIEPLTASQQRGFAIFNSEVAECFHCHESHNNTSFEIISNGLKAEYVDQGLANVTGEDRDIGKFKVPSLRNLKYTAPYMHDGSLETLEEVIEFYMTGGEGHVNTHPLIRPFFLNTQEKQDLLAFLLALSDDEFVVDETYQE